MIFDKQEIEENINRDIALILTTIYRHEAEIRQITKIGTSDYILLTNNAAKIWKKSVLEEKERYIEHIPIPDYIKNKVILIDRPIFDLDNEDNNWDIKTVRVGSNIIAEYTDDENENEVETITDKMIREITDFKSIEIKLVNNPTEDVVAKSNIFKYGKKENNE